MKALVTGATGFVGGHLLDALQHKGARVTALARSPEKSRALESRGVSVVRGDLHDERAIERAVRSQDVVFHVAGVVAARDEASFLRANRDGTRNMVEAATRAGCGRLVLVSSLAAAGPSPRGHPLNGSEPPHPVTAYGRSKLAAEEVVRSSDLQWTIVRPPIVYGPRDREVLKLFRLARAGITPVFGGGDQELSAVHATDLAQALIAAAGAAAVGRTYCACHPEIFTSGDFGCAIGQAMARRVVSLTIPAAAGRAILSVTGSLARMTGRVTILTADKANEFFQPAWTGDPAPLTRDTGWRAAYDLAAGLANTYQWYRQEGWL
jgi:dihydroflavonol-4-reductase